MSEIHDIKSIHFGLLTPEKIKKMAVCKIDNPKMHGPGSVYDLRMGCLTDGNDPCQTCGLKDECWGHWGYIELNEPIVHPMYYKIVAAFVECFCKKCYRLLLTDKQLELNGFLRMRKHWRFNAILEHIKKNNMCGHCGSPQPKIVYKSKESTISMEYKQSKNDGNAKISVALGVEDIKKIFDNIPDEDVTLLGFDPTRTKPSSLILSVLPVIPTCSRPYVISEGNICDDDLTTQYLEIVKINNHLGSMENMNDQKRKAIKTLEFRISTMFNNSKGKAKHPTDSRALNCYKKRLSGKGGRFRYNLMGKRVDFSSRTVIGAGVDLKMNEVGIPFCVAKILTKPEIATSYNIEWLTKLVNAGKANFLTTTQKRPDGKEIKTRINLQYAMFRKGTELLYGDIIVRGPGDFKTGKDGKIIKPKKIPNGMKLLYVITGKEVLQAGDRLIRDGNFIEVQYPSKKNINLKIGDIVERQLINGDRVLFNRQPTLHKGSMLGMNVVLLPGNTFRFNLSISPLMNADGDEILFRKLKF